MLICIYNDYTAVDNPYHEACLVEVIEVAVLDTVLRMYVGYQPEPRVYLVGVFVEGPLEVVYTRYMRPKLRATLYKAVCLLLADRLFAMCREERIRHIFNTIDPRWKSSCI